MEDTTRRRQGINRTTSLVYFYPGEPSRFIKRGAPGSIYFRLRRAASLSLDIIYFIARGKQLGKCCERNKVATICPDIYSFHLSTLIIGPFAIATLKGNLFVIVTNQISKNQIGLIAHCSINGMVVNSVITIDRKFVSY